ESSKLSKDEIEKMVAEAERFKKDDEENLARHTAKNQLENYAYSLKNSINEALKDKLTANDKTALETAIKEALEWLETNESATTEEFTSRLKELEDLCNPIVTRAYQSTNVNIPGDGPNSNINIPGTKPKSSVP